MAAKRDYYDVLGIRQECRQGIRSKEHIVNWPRNTTRIRMHGQCTGGREVQGSNGSL